MSRKCRGRAWRTALLCLLALACAGAVWQARRPQTDAATSTTTSHPGGNSLAERIVSPSGYRPVPTAAGSFGQWLAELPLKPGVPPVQLYDGRPKSRQDVHAAVIDIDVGRRDLQQCADAIIRLRAEYLYSLGRLSDIYFNFTSGHRADFTKWAEGYRPLVVGNRVTWQKTAASDESYESFRAYLEKVFQYAGTLSLSKELAPVARPAEMQIGDVFIRGGTPGHAVIVVSMAVNGETGEKLFLLAQSYMPAQDIHVLRNPVDSSLSPWYPTDFGDTLVTPEYPFRSDELMRFKD